MRVLLIEDDRSVAEFIVKGFEERGTEIAAAVTGSSGLAEARSGNFDVLIVDRMLPEIDGMSIIGTLRKENDQTPVLVLSALGEVDDLSLIHI